MSWKLLLRRKIKAVLPVVAVELAKVLALAEPSLATDAAEDQSVRSLAH